MDRRTFTRRLFALFGLGAVAPAAKAATPDAAGLAHQAAGAWVERYATATPDQITYLLNTRPEDVRRGVPGFRPGEPFHVPLPPVPSGSSA
jgi:hypothetical protein